MNTLPPPLPVSPKKRRNTTLAIFSGNIFLWLILAVTTGHEYELLFPTIALLPGAILCGALLRQHSYIECVTIIMVSAVLADLIWIVYETTFIDSTSHNLAPFELVAAGIFATIIGVIGVSIGKFIQRILPRPSVSPLPVDPSKKMSDNGPQE